MNKINNTGLDGPPVGSVSLNHDNGDKDNVKRKFGLMS